MMMSIILISVKFQKFFGIENSYNELITTLFKLNNIFYFRKKQKYEINNDINNIIELKYETKFLINPDNDGSKKSVIDNKILEFFNSKKMMIIVTFPLFNHIFF